MVTRLKGGREAGIGLMEVIVAAGLGTIVIAALMISMQKMSRFNKKVESSTDLSAIRSRLAEAVNCTKTFQTAGLPLGNPCPAGGYINLLASGGQMVVPLAGLVVGPWTVRAYCRSSDGSLDIRAAKIRPGAPAGSEDWRTGTVDPANFLRDEMDGNLANASGAYSWNHPKSRLFATGSAGLCSNWFSGTPGGHCSGPGEFVKSIDFNSNTAICGTVPTCPAGNALRFDGSTFSCDGNYEQRAADYANWVLGQRPLPPTCYNGMALQYNGGWECNGNYEQRASDWAAYKTQRATASATLSDTGSICSGIAQAAIRSWKATARCPSGFKAIGGSVECSIGYGGYLTHSYFDGDDGWFGQCCIVDAGGSSISNQVKVSCIRN
jgi:hypothetical protein